MFVWAAPKGHQRGMTGDAEQSGSEDTAGVAGHDGRGGHDGPKPVELAA
jgi:hypothetical protein